MKPTHTRDCSSCEHRVELNPHYQDMDFDDLPCATCPAFEPQYEEPVKAQVHLVEIRNQRTWGTGPVPQYDPDEISPGALRLIRILRYGNIEKLQVLCEALKEYTDSEVLYLQKTLDKLSTMECMAFALHIRSNGEMTQVEMAEELGQTKQAVNHLMKGIERKIPSLARIVRPNRKGEK